MARGEPPLSFILMAPTIVLSLAKSPLVILMGDTFSRRFIWERGKSSPVHGHIRGSKSHGDAWSMQEPASGSMHTICMDLRVGVGNAMLLYATQVHRGQA